MIPPLGGLLLLLFQNKNTEIRNVIDIHVSLAESVIELCSYRWENPISGWWSLNLSASLSPLHSFEENRKANKQSKQIDLTQNKSNCGSKSDKWLIYVSLK